MEAVAQPSSENSSDRTATTGGGVASDRLRVHAHLYKPRLKNSSLVPDFQAELRQYASKQGRNAALEYATALGTPEVAPRRAGPFNVPQSMSFASEGVDSALVCDTPCDCLDMEALQQNVLIPHVGAADTSCFPTSTGTARRAFLLKVETPATSDVEAALDQTTEEYISLLIGLVNAIPKPKKGSDSKDAGKGDKIEELASEMESEGGGLPVSFPGDLDAVSLVMLHL